MFYRNFGYFLRKKLILDGEEAEKMGQIKIYTLDRG